MQPSPLDEYPIHQSRLSMSRVATSDRNYYDRCYFNAHRSSDDFFLVAGLGVYPNLGVHDASAAIRHGDEMWVVSYSDALPARGLDQHVGGIRIEVLEPLRRLRMICEAAEHGIEFDLTWEAAFPAVFEAPHVMLTGRATSNRPLFDTTRFGQVGSWSGSVAVGGEELTVDPRLWAGFRDRSWGTRPVGEPAPPGRLAEAPAGGFWWVYAPIRFADHVLVVIVQEEPDGYRTLNDASRIFADGRVEQLGWPRIEIDYREGSRHPESARLHLTTPDGRPLLVEIQTLTSVPLHLGPYSSLDGGWSHGVWAGRDWSSGARVDLTDPEITARIPLGVSDHVARATCDGETGWGMFEHASLGRHLPSGFDA